MVICLPRHTSTASRKAKNEESFFTYYYLSAVKQQFDSGKKLEDIEVNFRLSVLKPLHAKWLVELFNFFTSTRGKEVIARGWKKSEIVGLLDGSTILPPEDPFHEIMTQ